MHLLYGFFDSDPGRRAARVAEDVAARLRADLIYDTEDHAVELAALGEKNYDLLVLGPRRRGAFDRARRSRRLTDQARCPVMHVPSSVRVGGADRIVLVHDISSASRASTITAARLAERLDVTLTIVQDAPDSLPDVFGAAAASRAARHDLAAAADAGYRPTVEWVSLGGRTISDLARELVELQPILVVAAKARRPLMRRLLGPSMGMRVARRAKLPVVLVATSTAIPAADEPPVRQDARQREPRAR